MLIDDLFINFSLRINMIFSYQYFFISQVFLLFYVYLTIIHSKNVNQAVILCSLTRLAINASLISLLYKRASFRASEHTIFISA